MPDKQSSTQKPIRIAVVAPTGLLDLQPSVVNAVRCFLSAGFEVDVFTVRNHRFALPDLGSARIVFFPVSFNAQREPRLIIAIAFAAWLPWVLRGYYNAIFAAGVRALLAAWVNVWLRPRRIINLQLELYIGPKLDLWWARLFKLIERKAIRSAWLSLIQDEQRASMLCRDAGIPRSKVHILPNSPIGQGAICTSHFLHRKLDIPQEHPLLLAPGTLGPQFCTEELVTAAQGLQDNWICVIHAAQPMAADDPYLAMLARKNGNARVIFSTSPVQYDQVQELMASARIGIALYGAAGGPNTTHVGLASGKLCQFLKVGVPVIVSDYPVLRQFVLKHRVGLPLSSLEELPKLIEAIESDYSGYRQRCISAFDKYLSFESHFEKVIAYLSPNSNAGASRSQARHA
jgi:glycosyltransferase involved in cell wall biosynthesis